MESARRAVLGDLAALAGLCRQGSAELAVNRGGSIWRRREARVEPVEDRLAEGIGRGGDELVVVGTIDEVPVGYGAAQLEALHDDAVLAVVSDLYVDPEARGIGVGEAMMDLLVAWATENGAVGIDALALPGDRHTKNFFETFGLTARAIVVHRDLTPPTPVAER